MEGIRRALAFFCSDQTHCAVTYIELCTMASRAVAIMTNARRFAGIALLVSNQDSLGPVVLQACGRPAQAMCPPFPFPRSEGPTLDAPGTELESLFLDRRTSHGFHRFPLLHSKRKDALLEDVASITSIVNRLVHQDRIQVHDRWCGGLMYKLTRTAILPSK